MSKAISTIKFDDTLALSECHDGWWLYDTTRGMNLAMRAKTKDDAFFEAIKYYQNKLIKVEQGHKLLWSRVNDFVSQFNDENDF